MKITGGTNWELDLKGMLRFEEVPPFLVKMSQYVKKYRKRLRKMRKARNRPQTSIGIKILLYLLCLIAILSSILIYCILYK